MKLRILSIAVLIVMLSCIITGCTAKNDTSAADNIAKPDENVSANNDSTINSSTNENTTGTSTLIPISMSTITDNVKNKDLDSSWSASESTQITLKGTTATVSGSGATVSGGTVTITKAGTYVVSGTLTKGQILINATKNDTVRLVLNGVDITSDTSAAIYTATADKLIIILADGTTNTVTDTSSYTYADAEKEEPNAAIFSKCDLTINGTGSLTINGKFNHGIATKDDLLIVSGNITVNSVNTALRGKDSVTILDGTFNLTSSSGDGIKSTNDTDADKGWILIKSGTFIINSWNDGIQAYTILQIDDGTFNITTGGGSSNVKKVSSSESYKGLKATGDVIINCGTFNLDCADDAIHSNTNVMIYGGAFTLFSGDDGIHADKEVSITDGNIDIVKSYEGIEGSCITISGGVISLVASDDGINVSGGRDGGQGGAFGQDRFSISNSNNYLNITGGKITVNAAGDGLDSNGSITMSGGTVYVSGPTSNQNGALDYDGTFNITGGILMAAGSSGMAEAPSTTSSQPSIRLYYTSTQSAATEIALKSSNGTTLASFTPEKNYQSVVISTPDMKVGSTYTIYSNGVKLTDVTLSSSVISISDNGEVSTGGMGGGPGMGNNPGRR